MLLNFDPPVIDGPLCTHRESLLGRHASELVGLLGEGYIISNKHQQSGTQRQSHGQRPRNAVLAA